jgi:S1-C subfamily serine protease
MKFMRDVGKKMKPLSIAAGFAALAATAFYALPALTADTKPAAGKPEPLRVAPPAPRALPAAPGSMGQVQLTFAPVVKRIVPAVVNVYARSVVQQQVNPFSTIPCSASCSARRKCASACSRAWVLASSCGRTG